MPSYPRCESCSGSFSPSFFTGSSQVCIMCRNKRDMEEKLKQAHDRIDTLTRSLETLQEFVSNNIGLSEGQRTAATAVASHQRLRPTQQAAPFTLVRNGARPLRKKSFLPITTFNRYTILTDEEEEEQETRLIGDSIIRGQLEEFCGRARPTRKRLCMPGGRLDDFTEACNEATNGSNNDTFLIVHAGTNDVQSTRSEELMEKYKKMIHAYKNKSRNVMISGILPRMAAPDAFYNKAFSTNNRLKSLCQQGNVEFIDLWNDFYNKPLLFSRDGLHLSDIGSARFGRLMSEKVSCFRQKKQQRPPADSST